jgi:hypothetical protein
MAGQRSLARSALVEAAEQFKRALEQIATLPATPALRREEINLQIALITPLIHVKGYAAPETKAAAERGRLLIEQAEALEEAPKDRLLLFSALYGIWIASYVAFDGNLMRRNATQFLALPRRKGRRSRAWSGIASWAFLFFVRGTSRRAGPISIALLHFMILSSIVRWPRGLAWI